MKKSISKKSAITIKHTTEKIISVLLTLSIIITCIPPIPAHAQVQKVVYPVDENDTFSSKFDYYLVSKDNIGRSAVNGIKATDGVFFDDGKTVLLQQLTANSASSLGYVSPLRKRRSAIVTKNKINLTNDFEFTTNVMQRSKMNTG